MKNTNLIKIIFDTIMLILLIMVYCASATGLIYHEITGLIIFLLFFIHLFYNRKWVIQVGKRIFDKSFNRKQKFMYVLNTLLLILFITAGISGIMMSKIVFKLEGRIGNMFILRYVHVFSAVLSVILIGIHIGIHWKMIIHTIKTRIHIPAIISKICVIITILAIFEISTYGIITSMTVQENREHGPTIQSISVLSIFEDVFNIKKIKEDWNRHELFLKRMAESALEGNNNDSTIRDFDGEGRGGPETHEGPKFQPYYVMIMGMEYLSILLLVSLVVFLIERNISRRNKHLSKE